MLARLNWHPSSGEIRYFANTLAVLAIVSTVILAVTGKLIPALAIVTAGIGLAVICRYVQSVGRCTYVIWMAVTYVLSLIISPVAIAFIYYIVLTPMAFFARIAGKDELNLKRKAHQSTHFTDADYDASPESFRRQF